MTARAFVEQSGRITPGHLVKWVTNSVVADGGTPTPISITSSTPFWNAKDKYNLDNTGQEDNAAALAQMAADLSVIEATLNYPNGSAGYPTTQPMPLVIFEPGVYAFSTWPNFALNNLYMEGIGQVELWRRGVFPTGVTGNVFGDALTFDGNPTPSNSGKLYLTFKNFRIVPIGTSNNSLVLNGIQHSSFDRIHVQGAGIIAPPYSCVRLQFCVCTNFDHLEISAFNNITSQLTPTSGGSLVSNIGVTCTTDPIHGFASSACTFLNTVIEGIATGVSLDSCGNIHFFGGTIEGCTLGASIDSALQGNTFMNMDWEANTTDIAFGAASVQNLVWNMHGATLVYTDAGTDNLVQQNPNELNQPLKSKFTPTSSKATLDASGQAGVSIANGANAAIAIGQGVLAIVTNMSSTSTSVVLIGGGGVGSILTGANWQLNTTTPSGGNQSIAFDGAAAYRIYNNTGGTKVYNVQTFRTG